jgi:hypothetical protein
MTLLDKRQCAPVAFWCGEQVIKELDSYCGAIPRPGDQFVMLSPLGVYRVVKVWWKTSADEWMRLHCNVVLEDACEGNDDAA